MDQWELESLRSANNGMRNQIDYIMDVYEKQQAQLAEIQQQLDTLRVRASSSDQLVEVTVDGTGVVTDVQLTAQAMRAKPENVGRAIVEAAQAAARSARSQHDALIAPIVDAAELMPDLPDLVPEAPSWRDARESAKNDGPRAG
ncbi:YbaB/EbfC family nucleoid-associated protein [Nocardia sp. NPDC051990]|uniref:YbaB/EbfC family nucleoid-associated protein n=1 Tax=Nocardia sp. NPDC051990 TaxID=3155285 RepID=UPI003414111C